MPRFLPLSPAYKVRTLHTDGSTTLSHRIAFRSIAATVAVETRKLPGVISATIIPA